MNKSTLFLLLICIAANAGCKSGENVEPVAPDPISVPKEDTCMSLPARDFNFRKGKWLRIQKPEVMRFYGPDTLWFKEDSLIGMSWQGDPYVFAKMYFAPCNTLWHKGWAPPQDTTQYGYWYMDYNKTLDQMTLIAYTYPKNDTALFRRFSK